MHRLVNLTTHTISLYTGEGIIDIPPSGLARVELHREVGGRAIVGATSVPILDVRAGDIIGLPPPDGVSLFIVSTIVERYANRADVVTVDKLIRTDAGAVMGAAALSRSA